MDNLPLQTMSFRFLISLLGAEKLSFESVSNVLGHTVYVSYGFERFANSICYLLGTSNLLALLCVRKYDFESMLHRGHALESIFSLVSMKN